MLVEDFVKQQFADALGFESAADVNPHIDFLEVGVDSLMATRVMLNLNEALDVTLPMTLMFEHPTITALAAEVERVRTRDTAQPAGQADSGAPVESSRP